MKQGWSDVPLEISNPNKEKDESAGGGGRILVCGLLHLRIAQVATITLSGGVRFFLYLEYFIIGVRKGNVTKMFSNCGRGRAGRVWEDFDWSFHCFLTFPLEPGLAHLVGGTKHWRGREVVVVGGAVKDTRTAERGVIVCQVAIQGFLEEIQRVFSYQRGA